MSQCGDNLLLFKNDWKAGSARPASLNRMKKKLFWSTKHDFASLLTNRPSSVPLAQKTASSKRCDVRGVGQILIRNIQFNAIRDHVTNSLGEAQQDLRKPLASSLRDQC